MKKKTLGEANPTNRGFQRIEFKDEYGLGCSLQISSATGSYLWLGLNDASPQIMRLDAGRLGLAGGTNYADGWMTYPVPKEVLMHTRMHLDRDTAEALINHLQAWLKNDSLEVK